jgi:cytokinesis protein
MYTNGLQRILELCASFGVPTIDGHIKQINTILQEDAQKLQERLDQEVLKDLENPQDVFNAISAKTRGTKAHDYFLSMMQHMLLIREDGQPMVHYYQLLDSIVTDVVMDKKLAGAEQRLGYSVDRIIAQFNEADRYIKVEDEANEARAMAMRLKLEKEALEEELAQGTDGLLSRLKSQVAQGEEKHRASRETISRLQKQLDLQKQEYEERIAQLEQQILELFRMLKEVGKEGVDAVVAADGTVMDRRALVEQLERNFQRHKTISILEGRKGGRRKNKSKFAGDDSETDSDDADADATPVKGSLRRSRAMGSKKGKGALPNGVRTTVIDENGRVSQFMDADEDDAQEQVQQQLAAGVKLVRRFSISPRTPFTDVLSVFAQNWLELA